MSGEKAWSQFTSLICGKPLGSAGRTSQSWKTPFGPWLLKFQVSASAMRIRAESMGFLLRKREATLFG